MDNTKAVVNGLLSDSEQQEERRENDSEPLLTLRDTTIRDVYRDNFQQQMKNLMKIAQTYNCISMDTEFPGINVTNTNDYMGWVPPDEAERQYLNIKQNVDNSRIIQIGLTLSDDQGRVPQGVCTWQFNFQFVIDNDFINSDSRDLLTNAGISFQKLKQKGIKSKEFSEYLVASGLVLNTKVKWVVFHGGYDFAYLLKMVHGDGLPLSVDEFYKLIKTYYPNIYDLKYLIKDIPNLKDVGLAKLANQIGCNRIGPQHQAGSDSLLTLCCYFKLKERKETQQALRNSSYINVIYGIGKGYIKSNNNSSYAQNNSMYWDSNEPYMHQHLHTPYYYSPDMYYFYTQSYIYPGDHQQTGGRM